MRHHGDKLALFLAHRGQLVSYASGIVGDPAHAEDVVQEAWLRFAGTAAAPRPDEPLAYLYRIVRNLALDLRRRDRREGQVLGPASDGTAEQTADDRPTPEAEAAGRDELRRLMIALDELPERTRMALEMHRFGGCRLSEIAQRLGISVTTAHSLVQEGVAHCRRCLRRPG